MYLWCDVTGAQLYVNNGHCELRKHYLSKLSCWIGCPPTEQNDNTHYLGLPVQHRLAASRPIMRLCILLLSFLSFFIFWDGTYRWESAHQAPADTIPTVSPLAMLIKYPQTFDPCCRLFTGAKCPKFWPKFRPQSSSDRRIFELRRFIGNQKQTWQDLW